MSRQTLLLISVAAAVVASLAFFAWAALRPLDSTAPPPAIVTPAALPAAATAPSERTALPGGVIVTQGFTVTLPTEWVYAEQPWPASSSTTVRPTPPQIVAWQSETDFVESPVRLSITTVPRDALSLEQYLADVDAQLRADPGVRDLESAQVTDVRVDGLPAGLIRYTADSAGGEVGAVQVALLDADGDSLVIATLADRRGAAAAETTLRNILATLQWAPRATQP